MKVSASELKTRAKKTLERKYGVSVGSVCIVGVVTILVVHTLMFLFLAINGSISYYLPFYVTEVYGSLKSVFIIAGWFLTIVLGVAGAILIQLLTVGMTKLFFNMCTGRPHKITDIFYAFNIRPGKFIGLSMCFYLISLVSGVPYLLISRSAAMTGFIPLMVVLMVMMYLLQIGVLIWFTLNFSMSQLILLDSPDKRIIQCLKESRMLMKGNKRRMLYLMLSFIGVALLGYFSAMLAFLWLLPYFICTHIHFYLVIKAEKQVELSVH